MSNLICFPSYYILIILFVVVLFTIWYIENKKDKINQLANNQPANNQPANNQPANNQFIRARCIDEEVLYNDFYPPKRRYPINIPSRGYPDNYQLIGVLLRSGTETAYNLFGRQKYPGSSQYEYYAEGIMNDNKIKLPIKINGDKEINDDDLIDIPGNNPANGKFSVKLYEYNTPLYIM